MISGTSRFGEREMRAEMRRALEAGKMPRPLETRRRICERRIGEFDLCAGEEIGAAKAAQLLCVEVTVVYRALRDGSLRGRKEPREEGFCWRIDIGDVVDFARLLYGVRETQGSEAAPR